VVNTFSANRLEKLCNASREPTLAKQIFFSQALDAPFRQVHSCLLMNDPEPDA
jgi:hypothetical protein